MILTYIILWWLVGFISAIITVREISDVYISDFLVCCLIGLGGPVTLVVSLVWLVRENTEVLDKIIFKKRNSK